MVIGFKRNGVSYLAASPVGREFNPNMNHIFRTKANCPIKKINRLEDCYVALPNSSLELYRLCEVLENLDEDTLSYQIVYDKVLPKFRDKIAVDKGIENGDYLNNPLVIYQKGTFYTINEAGTVNVGSMALSINSADIRNIILEALDLYKSLSAKELIQKLNDTLVSQNYFSMSLLYIYSDDGSGNIEFLEV